MSRKENRLKIFSALEVANICGVVNQTSINWIKNNYLKAFTTPGGQYRVYAEDLVDFLEARGMKIPDMLVPVYSSMGRTDGKTKKILIIDNDRTHSDQLSSRIVRSLPGCEIKTAFTGFEAGYISAVNLPEIIILSESVAGISLSDIRETCCVHGDAKKTKIIYLGTGKNREEKARGADLILVKPADAGKIMNFILSEYGGR